MADPCGKRICLMFLSFVVYAGMMTLIVFAAFDFGRDFGVFNNRTGEMLQKYSLPITPTRLVYDYWYLLYGLQIFFYAYAFSTLCRKAQSETPVAMYKLSLCPSVMYSLCIANNLAIILWLFLWDREYTVAALIVIAVAPSTFYIAFYYTCRGLYLDLALLHNSKADGESWAVRYLVHNIIGFLAAWLTISFVYSLGVVLVNEIGIDTGITSLALFGALMLELLIWLWVDVFLLDDFTRYTISTYFPMIVVTICLVVEVSTTAAWDRFKICVVVATALALACLVVKLVFLIYRHKKKPFLKVVKTTTKKTDESITVVDETEGKNGNGSVTVVTVEKPAKNKSEKEKQTKAIVNELHTKFEGGSKGKKGKQSSNVEIEEQCHNPEVEVTQTTVEVVDEVHDDIPNEKAESAHSASTAAVQEVDVHEEAEEPVVPPVDYDQDEPQTETPREENVMPVPQPMELTRENVEMVSHSAEAERYEGDDVFIHNEPGVAEVKNNSVDDNTNVSVEAQGSDEENDVDDLNEIPPPSDDLSYPQEYPAEQGYAEENVAEPEDYPPAPELLDVPEVPMCTEETRSTSFENDALPQEDDTTGSGVHDNSQRIDIDGTAKTLEEESDGEESPAKFAPSDADVVQAEVHSYDNDKIFENYSNGMENECIQTDNGKVYQLPDENSDGIYDSSDEGEVTLA